MATKPEMSGEQAIVILTPTQNFGSSVSNTIHGDARFDPGTYSNQALPLMLKQGWTIANMVATPNFVVFVMNPNAIRRQPARKSSKKHDRSNVDH